MAKLSRAAADQPILLGASGARIGALTAFTGGVRRRAIAVVAAAVAAVVLSVGISAPFEKDQETQSAQWIQGVTERGQWLLPTDDYGGIDRKPPLYYWLAAFAVKADGGAVNEVNARLVSMVAGVLLAAAVASWSAAYVGESTGWLALAFVLGTYGFASRATVDLTDMLLSLLLFAAWCRIYRLLEPPDPAEGASSPGFGASIGDAVVGGVLLGLAVLTKGPVAIVLIGLAGFIHLVLARCLPWRVLGSGWPWLMLALALVISACWYVPAALAGGPRVTGIFVSENFGHFLPATLGGTGEAARPLWYIAARMFGGALPMSLLVVALALALWRRDGEARARRPLLFQLSLVLAVLIFFSAASAKRDDYILPAMPGLAILFAALFSGAAIASAREASLSARVRDITTGAIAIAFCAALAGAFVLVRAPRLTGALLSRMQSSDAVFLSIFLGGIRAGAAAFILFAAASLIGALTVFAGLHHRRSLWTGAGLALIALGGSMLFTGALRPAVARARSMKTFVREVHGRIGGAPLYAAWGRNYELSFYYGRAVWGLELAGPAALESRARAYVVARPRELLRIAPAVRQRLKLVMQSRLAGGGGPPALYELVPAASHPNSGVGPAAASAR
jgi:4-amino-4-deoxy-L-arabinose transferase-like glycosyltransferase